VISSTGWYGMLYEPEIPSTDSTQQQFQEFSHFWCIFGFVHYTYNTCTKYWLKRNSVAGQTEQDIKCWIKWLGLSMKLTCTLWCMLGITL
jgi:hypothetical protein